MRLKSSRPLIIGSKKKAGGQSSANNGNICAGIILRFAESVPFFLLHRLRGFHGRRRSRDGRCQPDYSAHCNVHLSAGVSHARAIWHHVGSALAAVRSVYFSALLSRQWLFLFWLLESRSLILMTMGYVLLINIGHNSLNADAKTFFSPDCFIPPVRYSGSSNWRSVGAVVAEGIHAVYR